MRLEGRMVLVMKMPLHEMLRKVRRTKDGVDRSRNQQAGMLAWELGVLGFELFEAIADEIERCYIPFPCDSNGKPWKIGDEFEWEDLHLRCKGYLLFEGKWYLRSQHSQEFKASECKRPQPKVYDADGVEIKVGDTVWDDQGVKYTVKDVHSSGAFIEGKILSFWSHAPGRLTHKEPIVDVDGVPFKIGDTVWNIKNGDKLKVIGIDHDSYCQIDVEGIDRIGDTYDTCYRPESLTHKEPDSLEKLRDDLARKYGTSSSWVKRISALIEMGA